MKSGSRRASSPFSVLVGEWRWLDRDLSELSTSFARAGGKASFVLSAPGDPEASE